MSSGSQPWLVDWRPSKQNKTQFGDSYNYNTCFGYLNEGNWDLRVDPDLSVENHWFRVSKVTLLLQFWKVREYKFNSVLKTEIMWKVPYINILPTFSTFLKNIFFCFEFEKGLIQWNLFKATFPSRWIFQHRNSFRLWSKTDAYVKTCFDEKDTLLKIFYLHLECTGLFWESICLFLNC